MSRICTCDPRPAPRQPHTNPDCTWFKPADRVPQCFRHSFVNGVCSRCKRLERNVIVEQAQTTGLPEPSPEAVASVDAMLVEVRAHREEMRLLRAEMARRAETPVAPLPKPLPDTEALAAARAIAVLCRELAPALAKLQCRHDTQERKQEQEMAAAS